MSSLPVPRISPEEYLALDRFADVRSEYFYGEMFAMAGNTRQHLRIVSNLVYRQRIALEGRPCEAWSNEIRVKASEDAYVYPDMVVICGEPEFVDDRFDTLTNPVVVFEVLSSSTKNLDRGEKFVSYRKLPSLRYY